MRLLILLGLLALGMGTARADPETLYVGAGITYDNLSNFILKVNPENTRGYPDISAASWKALVGFRPLRWFAVEAHYLATAGTTGNFGDRSEVHALAGYAVFLTGTEQFEVFGKIGINGYTLTAARGSGAGESDSGAAPAVGGGFQWHFGRAGMRMEFEVLPSLGQTNGLKVVSLGAILDLY